MYFSLYDLKINLGFNAQDVHYFLCFKIVEKEYEVLLPNFDCCTFPSFYYVAFDLIAVFRLNRT